MEYVVLGVVVVIAVLIWRGQSGADFVITARPSAVSCKGKLAGAARIEIEQFFRDDLEPSSTWKVFGNRTPNGALHLRFRGRMTDADRQRIRNFLLAILGG